MNPAVSAILSACVMLTAFAYSQMRYHEGVLEGLRKAEEILRELDDNK